MTGAWFVDTNVLVYSRDTGQVGKAPVAQDWLAACWHDGAGRTSVQVLNEFCNVVTKKLAHPLSVAEARADILTLLAWEPAAVDAAMMQSAWTIQDRFGLSWWDCLVVAAAETQSCDYLLTEDLQDGQMLDGLQIVNPFAHQPADFA